MIKLILFNLERAIKYLEPSKPALTKREQVRNLVKKMAQEMDFPHEAIAALDDLDNALSVATDEQVDIILNHITVLIDNMEKEKQRTGIDFKKALAINKTLNN